MFPSRSDSDKSSSCTAGTSEASLKPSVGMFTNRRIRLGALSPSFVLFMTMECSFTAAAVQIGWLGCEA